MKRKRMIYGLLTMFFLAVEVLIALFVHDRFIRPYVGDMLVVVVLYTFLRIWIPEKGKGLVYYVFAFAAGVELLQYVQIVKLLGLEDNAFFRILIGSTFDVKDILCYGVGCVGILVVEWIVGKRRKMEENKRKTKESRG